MPVVYAEPDRETEFFFAFGLRVVWLEFLRSVRLIVGPLEIGLEWTRDLERVEFSELVQHYRRERNR
jgi:hypothetical protein